MPEKHVYVLGINAYDHDVSACLLRDGAIVVAISKERITRQKHHSGFFQEVVDYCLNAEGITPDDVDLVVRNSYVLPVDELEERMLSQDVPEIMDDNERTLAEKHPFFLSRSDKVKPVSHHLAHAYSGFAACPFDEGVLMVVDGVGSYCADVKEPGQMTEGVNPLARESESYYRFKGSNLETLKKVWLDPVRGFLSDEFYYMPGLGAVYSRVSSYIFADWNKCGEVMGLAPYGRPNAVKPFLEMKDGELTVTDWGRDFDKPWLVDREHNWEASPLIKHWEDMAWRIQDDAEKVLLMRAKWLRETTGAKNLVMAGGVALNCVANGRIAREAGFDNVWIQPAAGDDGNAIGCAYYGHLAIQKNARSFVMKHAFLGRAYSDGEVDAAVNRPVIAAAGRGETQRQYLRRDGEASVRRTCVRLVSGPIRIRAARARTPQHPGRPAPRRDEGQAEQAREAPAGVPPVRADRAGGTRTRDLRRRPGLAVHADGEEREARMARQDPGRGSRRRNGARSDGAARAQRAAPPAVEGI